MIVGVIYYAICAHSHYPILLSLPGNVLPEFYAIRFLFLMFCCSNPARRSKIVSDTPVILCARCHSRLWPSSPNPKIWNAASAASAGSVQALLTRGANADD
ncbi:hypothetical protein Zmor_009239 [Zophobas morio]|uniref:Uncharacterized protein n=1 Tax=Zophobas morio TaxID=2755281 RepID=A0AA38ILB9_9CUCU|nr:hypothetical protein Zmor_009239 [Zophobas morio]